MTGLGGGRHAAVAKFFVHTSGEDRSLYRGGGDGGRQEEALEEGLHQSKGGAQLRAQAGGSQAVGALIDALLGAADIAAGGSQAAAGIFDEGTDDHIGADIAGFDDLGELAVAVIHHADDAGLEFLDKADQLADLLDREGGAGGIALGALNGDQLGLFIDRLADIFIVEGAVRQQLGLPVGDAELGQ